MGLVKEFKEFAVKGNVVDMAVGIIIGAAFGKIVSSFVADIIMPPVGMMLGGVEFSTLSIVLQQAVDNKPAVVIGYGKFLLTVVDFTIIVFAIFLCIKSMNTLKRKEAEPVPPEPAEMTNEEHLLSEIRDLLKDRKPL